MEIVCIMWGNTAPDTEFPTIVCAGIGPFQLGVVLVYNVSKDDKNKFTIFTTLHIFKGG